MTGEQAAHGFQRTMEERKSVRIELSKASETLARLRQGNPESGLRCDEATKQRYIRKVEDLESRLALLRGVAKQNRDIALEACMSEGERFFINAGTELGTELQTARDQSVVSKREEKRLVRRELIEGITPRGLREVRTRLRNLRELEEVTIPARSRLLELCRELARGEGAHRLLNANQQRIFTSERAAGVGIEVAMKQATA